MEGIPYDDSRIERESVRSGSEFREFKWRSNSGIEFSGMLPFSVYPPRQDTNLLAQIIEEWSKNTPLNILEIGCGSGVLSCLAAKLSHRVSCCDMNPYAVVSTRRLAQENNLEIQCYEGGPGPQDDSNDAQWGGLGTYDRVLWNLPYLPEPSTLGEKLGPIEEIGTVAEQNFSLYKMMLHRLKTSTLLSKQGVAYFVVSSHLDLNDCVEQAWKKGLCARILQRLDFEEESIAVVGVWHPFFSEGEFEEHPIIDSTNRHCLDAETPVGSFVLAHRQTHGRGRGTNTWDSEVDSRAMSWVVSHGKKHPQVSFQFHVGYHLLRLFRTLNPTSEFRLKYPNDILVRHKGGRWKKCCGILIESSSQGQSNRVVLGIGINLRASSEHNGSVFDDDVRFSHWMVHASVASMFSNAHATYESIELENFAEIEAEFVETFRNLYDITFQNELVTIEHVNRNGSIVIMTNEGQHLEVAYEDIQVSLRN